MNYVRFMFNSPTLGFNFLARIEHPVSQNDIVLHKNEEYRVSEISHRVNVTMGAVVSDTETVVKLVKKRNLFWA